MKGYIYIASSFETVNRSACGQRGSWIDNDPHFWTSPPTWGICRPDLRAGANAEDVVLFVLPKNGRHPQMIFAYLTIRDIVTHAEAFACTNLLSKRMGNKTPNGNIIVNASGTYNRFDAGAHLHNFEKIKRRYAIGKTAESRMLSHREIQRLAPSFVQKLSLVIGKNGGRAIDIISRKGRKLAATQVEVLLAWLNQP
jgi:hypothetical protein